MALPKTHVPAWTEDNAQSDDRKIAFRCTECGKFTSGDRDKYDRNAWAPSMAAHPGPGKTASGA